MADGGSMDSTWARLLRFLGNGGCRIEEEGAAARLARPDGSETTIASGAVSACVKRGLAVRRGERLFATREARSWLRRFLADPLNLLSSILTVALLAMRLLAPVISPYDPNLVMPDHQWQAPSAEHWLGTDQYGRDVLARVLYGSRVSLFVGIVTVAPEIDGGLDLVRSFAAAGHRVTLGHSGADYDVAIAAIDAGARHATHLFNRMAPMSHRSPGLAGAPLEREDVVAELICDAHHVHPAICRATIAAKGARGVLAMTDVDLAAGWRGTYESPAGALLALRRAGFADLPALASSFLAEIAPLAATAGDIVGLEVEGGWSLGLSIGARASMRGTDQILTIDRLQAQRAWRTP